MMSIVYTLLLALAFSVVAVLITYLITQKKHNKLQNRIVELEGLVRSRDEDRAEKEMMYAELKQQSRQVDIENKRLSALKESQAKELEMLRKQMQSDKEERTAQFDEQLRLVKEQLSNASQEMLKQRAEDLHRVNSQQMDAIIDPLKETIREMKLSMDSNRDQSNKHAAAFEEQIKQMLTSAQNIGLKADNLANALRNENKIQGNWGELILSELLQSQGLKEGVHFEVQTTLRDQRGEAVLNAETGARMIPDVILHYPDNKDVVIDSKVSLTAFLDYTEATDDDTRLDATNRHLNSMKQHVKELSRKDYSKYIKQGRQSLDYVIMFVPNESALQLALLNDSHLWREAFNAGVFITSEQNLIAALRMIKMAWTQELQHQNQEKVFDLANVLVDRVSDFYARFELMGKGLDSLQKLYAETLGKLRDGRQSLLVPARQLVEMGARENPKRPLPKTEKHIDTQPMNSSNDEGQALE